MHTKALCGQVLVQFELFTRVASPDMGVAFGQSAVGTVTKQTSVIVPVSLSWYALACDVDLHSRKRVGAWPQSGPHVFGLLSSSVCVSFDTSIWIKNH